MLSGIRDEVVPREHMQGLWDIVLRRRLSNDKDRSATPELKETKSTGPNPNQSYTSWEDPSTMSRYVEFEAGTHSKSNPSINCVVLQQILSHCPLDDTCVQPGYWAIIAEFIRGITEHDSKS